MLIFSHFEDIYHKNVIFLPKKCLLFNTLKNAKHLGVQNG